MVENIPLPKLQSQVSQKIKIQVDDILEKLDCPICMVKLQQPFITKCGHTFCYDCISECVNRQHECPHCRANLVKEDIIRNIEYEKLIHKLNEERDKERHRYFEGLAVNALNQQDHGINLNTSPIETVFMLNLRESLLSFQAYYEELIKEKDILKNKVKTGLAMNLLEAKQNQNLQKELEINQKIEHRMIELDRKFQFTIDELVHSYDNHMKQMAPQPKLLPIRISIQIESKNGLKIENIHVKPYENSNDLIKMIEDYQVARGDPILSWNKDKLKIIVNGPLHQDDMVDEGQLSKQIFIDDWNIPFSKYNIIAGSTVLICGGPVQFQSDKPLECMTLEYDRDVNLTFNYFSCKTCNTNWICEKCKDGCHKGHNLLPHLFNHRPTWACCYCMKKDLCKIANKKNPNGKQ